MFKLLNSDDAKVFSNLVFIKNAEFFKDEIAFYDAYSLICEKSMQELPNYCFFENKRLCLEGVCLFMQSFASKFGFKTIDLTIDYLKVLYYSISALSKDGKIVERDLLINEYLVYKDANEKQYKSSCQDFEKYQKAYLKKKQKFDENNSAYAKNFITSKVFTVLSVVVMIVAFLIAMIPIALFYANVLVIRRAIIFAVATVLIGLVVNIEFQIFSKHIKTTAMELAYTLQMLKKNKNQAYKAFCEINERYNKILCEHYEYQKGLECETFSFEEILKITTKQTKKDVKLTKKSDIISAFESRQETIYEMVDKIISVEPSDTGRFENIYRQIEKENYLKYNNLVRFAFLNRFVELRAISKHWNLDMSGGLNPFGVDVQALAEEKIIFYKNKKNGFIKCVFNELCDKKMLSGFNAKNATDEKGFYELKANFIKQFYDYENLKDNQKLFDDNIADENFIRKTINGKNKIPKISEMKLAIIRNRVIGNSISEKDFSKISTIVGVYENISNFADSIKLLDKKVLLVENSHENLTILSAVLSCEVSELENDEVLCSVGGKKFKGFNFSNL